MFRKYVGEYTVGGREKKSNQKVFLFYPERAIRRKFIWVYLRLKKKKIDTPRVGITSSRTKTSLGTYESLEMKNQPRLCISSKTNFVVLYSQYLKPSFFLTSNFCPWNTKTE